VRALTKRSSRAVLYVDAVDLKSTLSSRSLTIHLRNFKIGKQLTFQYPTLLTGKTYAQSEPDITSAVARRAKKRGIAAISLTISAKRVGLGAAAQPWILAGEQSSLLTRIAATTESVSLCVQMKS
jgi:hypothetical protein